ncbi:MAG: bifunctional diaminohydroxyphosphoribosylaminopyrimidine deaminase/5-amino-6-(5-phosphoribosylamino)uracil reductase RibD [Candidatus Synoicihabitans palmerolidicus]|nr:bifunctional diaminohydroxyphosphoribosylaminopyrimidine deaminase/5-amino-6-(5-phosphoribosylamino)uracil reductase RibD [Candidatus Synoicihabitans palmerolidicus]
MSKLNDEMFMARALELARQAWGQTSPNPMVGAVITENGQIAAEGYHVQDGGPHAERVALTNLGRAPAPEACLYVTLEPCSTSGRTGACCEAILGSGIRRVVVGAVDPNPQHAGLNLLRKAGVEVIEGVLGQACTDLNLIFNHWITTGHPLVVAKTAVTIDGRIACRGGDSKWITNELSREDVHHWRRLFPSIAVGAMTVLHDNPRLTARQPDGTEWCPWRFVFDGLLRTVVDRNMPQVYTDEFKDRTIVVTTPHGGLGYVRKLENAGIKVWVMDSDTQRVVFRDFKQRCTVEGISGVYVEGGAHLIGELLRAQELDYLFNYRAPVLLADEKAKAGFTGLRTERLSAALRLTDVRHEVFGDDQLMRGRVVYPAKVQIDETLYVRN